MVRLITNRGIGLIVILLILSLIATAAIPARASDGLQTIDNPGGGQIVYGPLSRPASLSGALGIVLREIHQRFGTRPKIGRLFRAANSNSVATFISLTPSEPSARPIAGLVIVTAPAGAKPAAALIYDEADRFGKTMAPMMKKLNEAWNPETGRSSSDPDASSNEAHRSAGARPQPLHLTPFPDGSGSIGLPDGWKVGFAGRGGIHASGPNGEAIHLGVIDTGIHDTNNPRAVTNLQYQMRMGKPVLACPYGGDLVSAYQTISQQIHRRNGTPVSTLNPTNVTKLPPAPNGTPEILVVGELDNHDGKGTQIVSMRLGSLRPGALGEWSLTVNAVTVPKSLAEAEWSTMKAIVGSWRQNGAVIQHQTDVEIGTIHQIGKDVDDRIKREHEANDAHNAAVYKKWDNQDKYSKSFQNYQFDRSELQDNETHQRGAVDYQTAEALVKSDPNRYQYVDTPDFLKGVDY